MNSCKVAITIRSFNETGSAMALLRQYFDISYINASGKRLSEPDLRIAVNEADAVIAGTEHFSAEILVSASRLKAISRVGVGIDSIDTETAARQNIRIFNTPDAPVQAVAEHTLALILSLLKRIPEYNAKARRGDHSISQGSLLAEKTIGIIGMGRIGYRVAELLSAFGCHITYFDPYIRRPLPSAWERLETLQTLLRTADIITLHVAPQTDQTPLMNAEAFTWCKRGTIIVNTARGSCIDEDALGDALMEGIISAAGLDVSQKESLSGRLLDYPQVIVTPHVASNTRETRANMEMEAVNNLIRWQKELIR